MKKILIIQTASIGDVILATSVVETLHTHFEKCQIDILVKKQNAELFTNHPIINQIITFDRKNNKLKEIVKIVSKIRQEKYDICINIQRFFTSGLITALSSAKTTVGFNKNPLSFLFTYSIPHFFDGRHEIDRNFELLKFLDLSKLELPKLYPSENDFESTEHLKKQKYICIAPASLWFTKQFPAEKWADFISNLDSNFVIYILGASSDNPIANDIMSKTKNNNIVNLCGKLSLLESASLIKDALMNYTNDSAPLHIATSVRANLCAVFCSTVKEFGFGPITENSFYIEIEEKLICRPCGIHGHKSCPENHFNCAYNIKTSQLIEPLQNTIALL